MYFDGRHYDLFVESIDLNDWGVPFYIKQAEKYGDSILELACGTGRITIPIAEKGYSITGLDSSKPLIEHAKKKTKEKDLSIEWIQGDMTNFNLQKKFDLIILTGNAFMHLLTLKDLENCFANIIKHLNKNGRFIFETMTPCLEGLMADPSNIEPYTEYQDPDGLGNVVVRLQKSFDIASQIQTHFYRYKVGTKEITKTAKFRITFPKELDAILQYNGFLIEQKHGSFSEDPFTSDSPQQIFVCLKRD